MSIIKTLLEHALHASQEDLITPRVHGNGFIQLDMNKSQRVHFWGHHEIPRQKTQSPIHDHVFGFKSTVVFGTMINLRFDEKQDRNNGHYKVYEPRVRKGDDTTLHFAGYYSNLTLDQTDIVEEGDVYHMPRSGIHMTVTPEPTVTIIEKDGRTQAQGSRSAPRVFVPRHITPDNDFDRHNFDAHTLWRIIGEIMEYG